MPPHVMRHSRAVCGVALYLARRLEGRGMFLDRELVRSAALLHDITKRHSFKTPLDHALTGAKLLKHLGYPSIASVVRQHVRISRSRPPGRLSETEIVNYADKRVVEDRITSLEKRVAYIVGRYGHTPEILKRIEENMQRIFDLEKEIFAALRDDPSRILTVDAEAECRRS